MSDRKKYINKEKLPKKINFQNLKKMKPIFKNLPTWTKYVVTISTLVIIAIGIGVGVKSFISETQKNPVYKRYVLDSNLAKNTKILNSERNMFAPWKGPERTNINNLTLNCYFQTSDGDYVGLYKYEARKDGSGKYMLDKRGYRIVTKDEIIVDGKHYNAPNYIEEYGRKHKKILYMICNGPTKFINEYPEIIEPQEWYDFVDWFLTSVSYGPEIHDLENFTLSRGYKEDSPGVITLGGYSNPNREQPVIKFYPDGFYGMSPIYNVYSAYQNSLMVPYTDPNGKSVFSFEELKTDLREIFNQVAHTSEKRENGTPKFSPALIEKIRSEEDRSGKVTNYYKVYVEKYAGLIKKVTDKYPYILTETTESINFVWDQEEEQFNLEVKNSQSCATAKKNQNLSNEEKNDACWITTLSSDRGISSALIIKTLVPDYKFNNIFLRYTAMHEYYHHLTLTYAKKLSKSHVFLGAFNGFSGPSLDETYDLETLNEYFEARNPVTRALRTPSGEVRFTVDGQEETDEEIFGPGLNRYNVDSRLFDISQTISGNRGRAFRNWDDIKQLDSQHLTSILLRNAFDNYAGTLNPSIVGDADLEVLDENNQFVLSNESALADKGFRVHNSYHLQGFTGSKGSVESLYNVYANEGLFSVLQDRPTTGKYKYLGDWIYEDLLSEGESLLVDDDKSLDDLAVIWEGPAWYHQISYWNDLMDQMRGYIYNWKRSDNSIDRFYIARNISFINDNYKNVILSFPKIIEFTRFSSFDNFFPASTKPLYWKNFIDRNIVTIGGQDRMRITLNSSWTSKGITYSFDNIKAWPIIGDVNGADGTPFWNNAGSFLNTISHDAFHLTSSDPNPSLDNVNTEVINKNLLTQQVNNISKNAEEKANQLVQVDGETQQEFESRKTEIIKEGNTSITNYLYALYLLFSFVNKDVQISRTTTTTDANGNSVTSSETTAEWEQFNTSENQEIMELLKDGYGEYPKWYSQIHYYENSKFIYPLFSGAKGPELSPREYNARDVNSFLYPPEYLRVKKNGINDYVTSVREKNFIDDLGALFSNYTNTFPEILVRDYLQSSYVPSRKHLFPAKYQVEGFENGDFTEATSAKTLFIPKSVYSILFNDELDEGGNVVKTKYLVDKDLLMESLRGAYQPFYTRKIREVSGVFINKITNFLNDPNSNAKIEEYLKTTLATIPFDNPVQLLREITNVDRTAIISALTEAMESKVREYNEIDIAFNAIFHPQTKGLFSDIGITKYQGYFTDKWIKDKMKAPLYDTSTPEKRSAVHGAADFWGFIKKMQNIGETWINGITRKKSTDAIQMYGYLPNTIAKDVKYLVFEDVTTKKKTQVPIFKNVDNLFYLTQAVTKNSAERIHDNGYTSWISAAFVTGNFDNAVLPIGEYQIYFEKTDQTKVEPVFHRKEKEYVVTENGKLLSSSPSFLIYDEVHTGKSSTIYKVRNKFSG